MPDSNQSKQPGDSTQISPRPFANLIAGEPDLMRRCMMINMEVFSAVSGMQLSNFTPEEFIKNSNLKSITAIAKQVTEEPDATREWLDDESKRTPAQQQALEVAAREMLDAVKRMAATNYMIAGIHIQEYLDGMGDDFYNSIARTESTSQYHSGIRGETLNVPLFAVMYFFATHPDIDPAGPASLTPDDKAVLTSIFQDADSYYREHREELHTIFDLQESYIAARNPNPAKAKETHKFIDMLAIVPKNHVDPNHKLVNSLTRIKDLPGEGNGSIIPVLIEISKKGAKNKVTSSCLLSFEGESIKINSRNPFTEFDRNVYSSVVSLAVAGNNVFTSAMVWRTMTGKTDNEKPTPAQLGAVTKSLDKWRCTLAEIDCSAELKMRNITLDDDEILNLSRRRNLLQLDEVIMVTRSGKRIRGYELLKPPILYEYSRIFNQVITVPLALLDVKQLDSEGKPTKRSIEYTERRNMIISYLIRRIEGMRGGNSLLSRYISFQSPEGLYTIAGHPELAQPMPDGLTDADKQQRKNCARYVREDAKLALDYWKAVGFIRGYQGYKSKSTLAGFEIDP